jgi:hypothetical protein
MISSFWFKIVRWTAVIVLLNVGLGLYVCMKDVPVPINQSDAPSLVRTGTRTQTPACSDDCDSCICCASLIISEHRVFGLVPVLSNATAALVLSSSDPDPDRMKRPPRA